MITVMNINKGLNLLIYGRLLSADTRLLKAYDWMKVNRVREHMLSFHENGKKEFTKSEGLIR